MGGYNSAWEATIPSEGMQFCVGGYNSALEATILTATRVHSVQLGPGLIKSIVTTEATVKVLISSSWSFNRSRNSASG